MTWLLPPCLFFADPRVCIFSRTRQFLARSIVLLCSTFSVAPVLTKAVAALPHRREQYTLLSRSLLHLVVAASSTRAGQLLAMCRPRSNSGSQSTACADGFIGERL